MTTETIKLCPFRREFPAIGVDKDNKHYAEKLGDFAPCLQDKCAMWRVNPQPTYQGKPISEPTGYCGLAGKP